MLILIAGITGNIGQHLARVAISRGLDVRGLGRTPEKLDPSIKLESFVRIKDYYDVPALEAAVRGVDAVISAYQGAPELQLDGQLLLLRAAERAGVRIFAPACWNYDWADMQFGLHEGYDNYIAFRRQVDISSTIKPLYIFTGVLAEVFFSKTGRVPFNPRSYGPMDVQNRRCEYYGTGNEIYQWTTEEDAAKLSIEMILSPQAQSGEGGLFYAVSGENSVVEAARIYEAVRGTTVTLERKGSVEDLEKLAYKLRGESSPNQFHTYIGAFYQLFTLTGLWHMKRTDLFPQIQRTSLEEFLRQNPDI